jgi:D-3-phosphoglycerate dehydrogenase
MEAAAYDPYIADDIFDLLGVERKYELPDLLRDADYVTIHVPLTGETRHMINRETLSMMKSRAVLINTARGAIIEEDDLADALKRGVIDGAGIDVLEKEPPRKDHPLVSSRETVVTPHVAWYSEESFEKNKILGMDELVRVLKGRRPRYIVNPQVFCCG